jgi:hypothetical protein
VLDSITIWLLTLTSTSIFELHLRTAVALAPQQCCACDLPFPFLYRVLQAVFHILICSFLQPLSQQLLVQRPITLLSHGLLYLWYDYFISILLLFGWLLEAPFADLLLLKVLA